MYFLNNFDIFLEVINLSKKTNNIRILTDIQYIMSNLASNKKLRQTMCNHALVQKTTLDLFLNIKNKSKYLSYLFEDK